MPSNILTSYQTAIQQVQIHVDANTKVLDLLSSKLGNQAVSALVVRLGEIGVIEFLTLADNLIGDEIIPIICANLITNPKIALKTLDLSDNKITEEGAQKILTALQTAAQMENGHVPKAVIIRANREISVDTRDLIENFSAQPAGRRVAFG